MWNWPVNKLIARCQHAKSKENESCNSATEAQ